MTPHSYHLAALIVALVSLGTLVVLLFISAPYGRHARSGWGPTVPARLAWIIMELPAPLGFVLFYVQSERATLPVPMFLATLFMIHYIERTFVYPFRMRWKGKRT